MNIYIHIPFCAKKCHYCYYYSLVPRNQNVIDQYLLYLKKEFKIKSKRFDLIVRNDINTVYIGGGTPNYLSAKQFKKLFNALNRYINLSNLKEFTVEMDPAFCTKSQLNFLKKNGVTRLSFGIQTLNKKILKAVNRHFDDDPARVILFAKKLGFEINLDFILGLPYQTIADVKRSLDFVEKIKPDSSFWCELRIGTPIMRKMQSRLPSHKKVVIMHQLVKKTCRKWGYHQIFPEYFSLKKELPLYLNNWWTSNQSLGFGLAAFSKINNRFVKNTSDLQAYYHFLEQNKLPIFYIYKLDKESEALIHMLSSLRKGSADLNYFQKKFKVDLERTLLNDKIKQLKKQSYLKYSQKKIILTNKGFSISSPVSKLLLRKKEYLGKLMDTAFNHFDGESSLKRFIYKNFFILGKKDEKEDIIFISPDRKNSGIMNNRIDN